MSRSQTPSAPQPKSRRILIIVIAFFVLIALGLGGFFLWQSSRRVSFSPEYYDQAHLEKASVANLEGLVAQHKSFGVFVSQPNCRTADDLRRILEQYSAEHQLTFYEVAFSELKDSELAPDVKYYPSFIIFDKGKVATFLRANSAEDSAAYNSLDGFSQWFESHAKSRK